MNAVLPTFEVDKAGLRKLLARKGMGWILPELIQNAWDEDVREIEVSFTSVASAAGDLVVTVAVEDDDPDGFTDLSHAYTLFAESEKKDDATRRGRFNVGEKLVVAAAEYATIATTTGTIRFTPEGRFHEPASRDQGSRFEGTFRMTHDEYDDALRVAKLLLPPKGVVTTINGEVLPYREHVRRFTETLRTPVGAELKIRDRKATIALYEPSADETPMLYEMGIPVVALLEGGDHWHIDIGQKVPLNMDRDNVTPAYLRTVRRIVLDHAHDLISEADAREAWTTDAASDEHVSAPALGTMLDKRFGEKRVSYDPSDPEANKLAVSEGYTVVHGGMLPKDAWKNVKGHDLIKPAGQVTPSPKPYEPGQETKREVLPVEKWTPAVWRVANFSRMVAWRLLGAKITVEIVNDPSCMNFAATYGRGETFPAGEPVGKLEFNLRTLGRKWFEEIGEKQVSLILHELGHHIESDHLSRRYLNALTDLGAKLALAIVDGGEGWWEFMTSQNSPEAADMLDNYVTAGVKVAS
jgi:hypothetical protein